MRYRYDEGGDEAVSTSAGDEVLTTERLSRLPSELLRDLSSALEVGEFERAAEVAERIRQVDERLGRALGSSIQSFQLDEVLTLLESVEAAD